MRPRSGFSEQTLSVLEALCDEPSQWRHGYALAKQTGLKSGTLYPILIRLADRGLVEACWQDEPQLGRPRRHLYRVTADGLAAAAGALAGAAEPAARPERGADAWHIRTGTGNPGTVNASMQVWRGAGDSGLMTAHGHSCDLRRRHLLRRGRCGDRERQESREQVQACR